MRTFGGFPAGKTRFTPIPDLFYSELLLAIDDLAELKLTLFMFWALNRQTGYPRYMTLQELESDSLLLSALEHDPDAGRESLLVTLHGAIDNAVRRSTLLRLSICEQDTTTDYFFINTPQGRKAVQQVKRGELILETTGYVREAHVERSQLSIFELYEQNIGLVTPLLVEELEEAQSTLPHEWLLDAFRIAVEHNARNWRYIKSILTRWEREGKDDGSRATDSGQRKRRAQPRC